MSSQYKIFLKIVLGSFGEVLQQHADNLLHPWGVPRVLTSVSKWLPMQVIADILIFPQSLTYLPVGIRGLRSLCLLQKKDSANQLMEILSFHACSGFRVLLGLECDQGQYLFGEKKLQQTHRGCLSK